MRPIPGISSPSRRESRAARVHAYRAPSFTPRSGAALVLFAMLVFAFMGIAALTIDMGIASFTQAQMQNAADTASLEGVRLRDFAGYRITSDPLRRPHVSELVQMVFDDDLHPTSGVIGTPQSVGHGGVTHQDQDDADALQMGVGPGWYLGEGGAENVGATLHVPDAASLAIDDPVLQYNGSNLPNGDMLSGKYNPFSSHIVVDGYDRPDFAAPTTVFEGRSSIGFLVRMRRTNVVGAPDNQPGVSSGGPTLPFVFGLGSTIRAGDSGYDPRSDGLTVRATAIAAGRPAMAIGPTPNVDDRVGKPMLGMGFWYVSTEDGQPHLSSPLALSQDLWIGSVLHTDIKLRQAGSTLFLADDPNPNPVPVGSLLESGVGRCVGEEVVGALLLPTGIPVNTNQISAFFPIYARIANSDGVDTNRIVGFGYGKIMHDVQTKWVVTKGFLAIDDGWVAPDNASAHLNARAPTLSSVEWANVFDAYNRFGYQYYDPPFHTISFDWQDIRPGTVLAPALVR